LTDSDRKLKREFKFLEGKPFISRDEESESETELDFYQQELDTDRRAEQLDKAMRTLQESEYRIALENARERYEMVEERYQQLRARLDFLIKGEKARNERVSETRNKVHKCYETLEMARSKVAIKSNNLDLQLKHEKLCKEILQDRIQNEANSHRDKRLAKEKEKTCKSKVRTLSKTITEKKLKLEELKAQYSKSYISSIYGYYDYYFGKKM